MNMWDKDVGSLRDDVIAEFVYTFDDKPGSLRRFVELEPIGDVKS